ncbi:DUF3035 domain-containing protein [Zavarzinia sp.]|uniref:DUF3035 domain-containing protein n=1 Tax=Zavarzinia sp. TaxID=2027920 RepID=UPI0035633F1D
MSSFLRSTRGRLVLAGAIAATVGLAGCDGSGDMRSKLGLATQAPDEFSVVTAAPLVVPPDYSLRPPEPGAAPTQQGNTEHRASEAVFGATLPGGPAAGAPVGTGVAAAPGPLEQQFLTQAGAGNADPQIRATLNRESGALVDKSQSFARELLGLPATDPTDIVVNASQEAQRLRQNAAGGLPATTGDTPLIKRGNPGLLEGVF